MYLLPAGQAPRTNTKLAGLRGLGAIASRLMSNGGGPQPRSNVILYRPPVLPPNPPTPVFPGPPALWPGRGSVGIRPIPIDVPVLPPNPPTPQYPPAAAPPSTPVPSGFPTSSAYTDTNGNIWTYANGQWAITGSVQTGGNITSVPGAPVSVTVTPAAAESGYQAILDWLTQTTLVSPVPNWIVAGGVAFGAWKMFGSSSGGKR